MSAGVSLCMIWFLYGYTWWSFFNILCNNVHERPNYWEHLWRDFFGLLPIESLTTFTLPGDLAVDFLLHLGFSTFLWQLFTDPEICEPMINLSLLEIIVEVKIPTTFFLHSYEWFSLQKSSDAKYIFLSCPRHSDRGLIVVIVYYFQIWNKKEHNIINSRWLVGFFV